MSEEKTYEELREEARALLKEQAEKDIISLTSECEEMYESLINIAENIKAKLMMPQFTDDNNVPRSRGLELILNAVTKLLIDHKAIMIAETSAAHPIGSPLSMDPLAQATMAEAARSEQESSQ